MPQVTRLPPCSPPQRGKCLRAALPLPPLDIPVPALFTGRLRSAQTARHCPGPRSTSRDRSAELVRRSLISPRDRPLLIANRRLSSPTTRPTPPLACTAKPSWINKQTTLEALHPLTFIPNFLCLVERQSSAMSLLSPCPPPLSNGSSLTYRTAMCTKYPRHLHRRQPALQALPVESCPMTPPVSLPDPRLTLPKQAWTFPDSARTLIRHLTQAGLRLTSDAALKMPPEDEQCSLSSMRRHAAGHQHQQQQATLQVLSEGRLRFVPLRNRLQT